MPRKQRFKPSRKPKPMAEETIPGGDQVVKSAPAVPMVPNERERDEARIGPSDTDRTDIVIDHERPR